MNVCAIVSRLHWQVDDDVSNSLIFSELICVSASIYFTSSLTIFYLAFQTTILEFKGCSIAVDVSCLLHKGLFGSMEEFASGKDSKL